MQQRQCRLCHHGWQLPPEAWEKEMTRRYIQAADEFVRFVSLKRRLIHNVSFQQPFIWLGRLLWRDWVICTHCARLQLNLRKMHYLKPKFPKYAVLYFLQSCSSGISYCYDKLNNQYLPGILASYYLLTQMERFAENTLHATVPLVFRHS